MSCFLSRMLLNVRDNFGKGKQTSELTCLSCRKFMGVRGDFVGSWREISLHELTKKCAALPVLSLAYCSECRVCKRENMENGTPFGQFVESNFILFAMSCV